MKLLSVSRSFVGGKSQPGRYKMAQQGTLPKFAPVSRPVSLAPKRENSARPVDGTIAPSIASSPAAGPLPMLPLDGPKTSPSGGPGGGATAPRARARDANTLPASTKWFRLRKNPFTSRRTRPRMPAPGQLSLDAVKPVRNDLSDADLEVVLEKQPSSSGASKPTGPRTSKAEMAGLGWSRLAARLFNSGRVRV